MHFLQRVSELHAESRHNVPLQRAVLGVHQHPLPLIIHDAHPEPLCLRCVERSTRALNIRQKLLPMYERIAEVIEDVFRLEDGPTVIGTAAI